MEIITESFTETKKLGQKVGASLKGGEVIALVGGLGAGKTTFVQGLAQGLGVTSKIISPTFILMRNYKSESRDVNLFHLDLYRLEGDIWNEVTNLGVSDFWEQDNNVFVIEWAEKIKDKLPKKTSWIYFENLEDEGDSDNIGKRKITFK